MKGPNVRVAIKRHVILNHHGSCYDRLLKSCKIAFALERSLIGRLKWNITKKLDRIVTSSSGL
jgi:hypothetical protein